MAEDRKRLAGLRAFAILWSGQTVSLLGSRVTGFALALWIFEETGRATSLALVGLSFGAASILINFIAGVLVDRLDRKLLIGLTDALAGVITAVYLVLFLAGRLEPWHIYLGAAVRGGLNIIQSLAFAASVPLLVSKTHFVRASTMQSFAHYAGNIAGPGLGALLYTTVGLTGVMIVDLFTFVVALTAVFITPIPRPEVKQVEAGTSDKGLPARLRRRWADLTFGFRHIFARPGLRALLLSSLIFTFFDGPPNALLAPLVLARTGNDAGAYAAVGMASGIGGVAISLCVTLWGGPRRDRVRAFLLSMISAGIAKVGISLSRSTAGWAGFQGYASANFPLIEGTAQAVWLAKVNPAVQGQVMAARSILSQLAFYLGFGLAAPLADYVFEPALAPGGWLVPSLGWLFGVGPGAGFALVFFLAAVGMATTGAVGFWIASLRRVETIEADYEDPLLSPFSTVE